MKRKRYRTQVKVRLIEYELHGRHFWWPESLSKKESKDIGNTLLASGIRFKVHKLKLSNAESFVKPMKPSGPSKTRGQQ